MSAVFLVALAAPGLAALAAAFAWRGLDSPRAWEVARIGAAAGAAAWALLLVSGSKVELGPLHSGPLFQAAGCGAALLAASVRPRRGYSPLGGGLAASALTVALATGASGGGREPAAIGMGVALAAGLSLLTGRTRNRRDPGPDDSDLEAAEDSPWVLTVVAATGALAVVAVAVAVVLVKGGGNDRVLPQPGAGSLSGGIAAAFVLAAAALMVAGCLRPGRASAVLLVAGATVALRTGPLVHHQAALSFNSGGSKLVVPAVVVVLGAVGAGVLRRGVLALALLGLAAATGPIALLPAARILESGAVLAMVLDPLPPGLLAVPGTVALVVALVQGADGVVTAVFGGAALAIGILLALDATGLRLPGMPVREPASGATSWWTGALWSPVSWIAGGLAGWLLLAPGSWKWAGSSGLAAYDEGAARAVAAGLVVSVATTAWGLARADR